MTEASVHGHAILHYIEDNAPVSLERLTAWAHNEFGSQARYHACFASDMDLSALLGALKDLGKIQHTPQGFVFGEGAHICDHE